MSFPHQPLKGKVAIVTGSSRGIGAAIAENLGTKGASLILNCTSSSSLAQAQQLAEKLGTAYRLKAAAVQADIGTPEGVKEIISLAQAKFADADGKLQIDIIINNAGIADNAPLPEITINQFESTYRVNVLGPLLLVQAAQPYLPKDRSGRIVNISSVSSSCGFVGQSVYGGSKAAIEAMTRTWSRELAENCTVNAVNPGPVEGPMYASNSPAFLENIEGWIKHTPLMKEREGLDGPHDEVMPAGTRGATTREIAGIVGMLCGEEAAWCTGQVVCANGGMVMLH